MNYSVFDSNNKKDHVTVKAFFDDPPTLARYDKQKYPKFYELYDQQLNFFWRPQEVSLVKDIADYKNLSDEERFVLLGMSAVSRILVIIHCYRKKDKIIRIISARKATKKETIQYRGGL